MVKLAIRNAAVPRTPCPRSRRSTLPDFARLSVMAMMIQPIEVLADRRGYDDLPEVAAGETHFPHDRRHDLDRGDRQRGAEEKRGEKTLVGMRQQAFRHELAEREAAGERHGDAGERDAQRRFADPSHQLEVGLHPGEQQQQQDAELRDAVEHGLLLGGLGKRACCRSGSSAPSTEGPSRIPPSNIPMTEGWPIRFMASPRSRPTSISVISCARKMTSEAPPLAPSAAKAAAGQPAPARRAPQAAAAQKSRRSDLEQRRSARSWDRPQSSSPPGA